MKKAAKRRRREENKINKFMEKWHKNREEYLKNPDPEREKLIEEETREWDTLTNQILDDYGEAWERLAEGQTEWQKAAEQVMVDRADLWKQLAE